MIWHMLIMSILIWAGWFAALTYLSEPLADKIAPTVARFHKGRLDDDWVISDRQGLRPHLHRPPPDSTPAN